MIEEIGAAGQNRARGIDHGETSRRGERVGTGGNGPESKAAEVVYTDQLRLLTDRLHSTEGHREGRVRQVLEKIEQGTLVSQEALRKAAEKLLREGP